MSDLPHLRLVDTETSYDYTAPGGGGGEFQRPPRDRAEHADKLKNDLASALSALGDRGFGPGDPIPLTYELQPHALDVVESLERQQSGIQLLSVIERPDRVLATVRVPATKYRIIEAVLDRYAHDDVPRSGRPKHENLVANIDLLRLATIADLWTDSLPFPGADVSLWWEVWLYYNNTDQPEETHQRFAEAATTAGFSVRPRHITFPDRVVVLAYGTFQQWNSMPRLLLMVAELRRAKELASDYVDIAPRFQGEIIAEVRERLEPPSANAPAVCLLDTGVDRRHPLIEVALADTDCHSVDPAWRTNDHDEGKHGTGMAGIALYGPLTDLFTTDGPITLRHRLESVKILPPSGRNNPELYGNIVQEAVARAESVAPHRIRVCCLTVTADCRDGGRPSSWSAAIDQMCAGGEVVGNPKLICVSAGNLRDQINSPSYTYPIIDGRECGVEDPGQAWNALTVGAMTDLVMVQQAGFEGYQPIASTPGDLSPTSRTSLAWPEDVRLGWPLKPDVVMEGGNWATTPGGVRDTPEDLGLLTTIVHPDGRLLTITRDTSPATAGAARLAAQIWARYPNLWPETVRGLIVHSANWTDAMRQRFPGTTKSTAQQRLRCYGYGVPSLRRALHSAENAATLLFEGELQPYKLDGSDVKSNKMHVHTLPWPVSYLQELGDTTVRMHVTLSYFVEPSPGRRGWTRRHRYASHGLRFDVMRRTETPEQFIQRLMYSDSDEEADTPQGGTENQPWVIGKKGRSQGSIHSDWWEGPAADLAACAQLAIFPVTGWWRERRHLNRWNSMARYSLILSLETDAEVELYTAIVNQAMTTTEVVV